MFAAHTGSNVVLDALVLGIVVPLYFRRETAWKQRLGIGLLLLLGLMYVSSPPIPFPYPYFPYSHTPSPEF